MRLILSCITKGEIRLRDILDRLAQAGIAKQAIVVVHPGSEAHPADGGPPAQPAAGQAALSAPTATGESVASAAGAVASAGGIGGMFGWLVGYGVLSLPGALLGGAVGAVAGAAIRATQHVVAHHHLTDDVQHHYAGRIIDDHAAVLVQVQEMQQYEKALMAFLDGGGRHILTSRNDPVVAETAQLEALAHHPALIDEADPPAARST